MSTTLADIADQSLIDTRARGIPPGTPPTPLADLGRYKWSVPDEDLCLPVLTISEPALTHNLDVIDRYAKEHGLWFCTHGKTTMAPQLLRRILGMSRTIGLCAATTQQATIMAETGAPAVFIVNQVVGRANLRRLAGLADLYPATRFLILIDSATGYDLLRRDAVPALEPGRRIDILIDVGVLHGRTGVRDLASAIALLDYIAAHADTAIRLVGISTYEGVIPADAAMETRIGELFALARDVYIAALTRGLDIDEPIISAGGSASFDLVATHFAGADYPREPQIWVRPGVAATYDSVAYRERLTRMDRRNGFVLGGKVVSAVETFQPAMALWAVVQSIPDGDVALVAAGIRDFPNDAGYPTLLAHYRDGRRLATFAPGEHSMTKANDQHGYLPIPPGLDLRVGDVLKFGISHPCTAFDKWPVLFLTDADDRVLSGVRTYF